MTPIKSDNAAMRKSSPRTTLISGRMDHWLHIAISNAKAFILGTYHGLPKKSLQSYLDEYSFRFSRRSFGPKLLERLTLAVGTSVRLS